jgi:hypothetical protein
MWYGPFFQHFPEDVTFADLNSQTAFNQQAWLAAHSCRQLDNAKELQLLHVASKVVHVFLAGLRLRSREKLALDLMSITSHFAVLSKMK